MPYKVYGWDDVPEKEIAPLGFRKVIWGKNQTLARFYLKRSCQMAPHSHESEQISYVMKGAVRFQIDGEEILVSEGGVIDIPPNVIHGAEAVEDSYVLDTFSPIREDWLKDEMNHAKRTG